MPGIFAVSKPRFRACGQDVIQTAKTDVIGPAIATDDPMGGCHQKILAAGHPQDDEQWDL